MLLFSSKTRRKRRKARYQHQLSRLANVETTATNAHLGRVVTVMMTTKPDPQRGAPIAGDLLHYMNPWWTTVNRVGLNGVVLHDGLPTDFIRTATTKHVKFHRCPPGEFPILHLRHFSVRDFLEKCDDEFVLITDVSDVAFKKDPFPLIRENCHHSSLFIGSETKTIGANRCLKTELTRQYGQTSFSERRVVNPGILGGRRQEVLQFLNLLTAEIERLGEGLLNSDMSIVNHVFHSNYNLADVFTGAPLHSQFRKWEFETTAAILHK